MKQALVLGGSGFMGFNLGLRLSNEGWFVRLFDINFPLDRTNYLRDIKTIEVCHGNFFNHKDLDEALKGVDRVFHFISTTVPSTSKENLEVEVETNLLGTVRLLELMRNQNVSEIIYPSSGGTVYGQPREELISEEEKTEPECTYGLGKKLIEEIICYYCKNMGFKYRILRISNPYGDFHKANRRQGVIDAFLANVLNEIPLTIWGTGENIRDFIFIEDVIDAIISLDKTEKWNETYNIGTGKGTSVRKIIEFIKEVTNKNVECIYTGNEYSGVSRNVLDISKINNHAGWYPKYEIREGIERTWNNLLRYSRKLEG